MCCNCVAIDSPEFGLATKVPIAVVGSESGCPDSLMWTDILFGIPLTVCYAACDAYNHGAADSM